MENIRRQILNYLETNSRIDLKELAVLLGTDEVTVVNEVAAMEKEKIICGYHTLIDWDRAGVELVNALIEVRVTPQRGKGFDRIAERIYNYPEVRSVYLISGAYDLMVISWLRWRERLFRECHVLYRTNFRRSKKWWEPLHILF